MDIKYLIEMISGVICSCIVLDKDMVNDMRDENCKTAVCMWAVWFHCTSNSYFKASRRSFPWHMWRLIVWVRWRSFTLFTLLQVYLFSLFLSCCLYHLLLAECQPLSSCLITAVKTTRLSHKQQTKKCLEL